MYRNADMPLEIRNWSKSTDDTPEGKKPKIKSVRYWGVSYMPLPFKSRFRYMQRNPLYTIVEVKQLESGTPVESFHETNWEKARPEWEKAEAVWKRNSLYGDELKNYQKVSRTLKFPKAGKNLPDTQTALNIDGPGIIRSIRVKVAPEFRQQFVRRLLVLANDSHGVGVDNGRGP